MENLPFLCYNGRKVEIGVKMMESRTLNKILLIVIAVALIGILVTSILSSPNFANGIFKSSAAEIIISSDVNSNSENITPSSEAESSSSESDSSSSAQNNQTATEKYNLNTVTLEQLITLPNIGEAKAKAILELRTRLGKFTNVSQLKSVKGIGSKTYEKLKDYFYV